MPRPKHYQIAIETRYGMEIRSVILMLYRRYGNATQIAHELGISRGSLYNWLGHGEIAMLKTEARAGALKVGSHPADHMPPVVAEPPVVDAQTKAFMVQLAQANENLRAGMSDLVDLVAKLEAELKEATAKRPAKLEGLAAKLFRGWSEHGADAFYDEREERSR